MDEKWMDSWEILKLQIIFEGSTQLSKPVLVNPRNAQQTCGKRRLCAETARKVCYQQLQVKFKIGSRSFKNPSWLMIKLIGYYRWLHYRVHAGDDRNP